MYSFQSLQLNNYLTWDEVEFVFESGLTLVRGRNRSGKSLLFSPLAGLYDDNVPPTSRAVFSFDDDQHSYDFAVFNKGQKSNKYAITIDDKDQSVETRAAGLNLIERYFTSFVQESLFHTTVSISGLTKHPLATGKPAERLDWVHETLAYASLLDAHIENVEKQIKPARDNSVKFKLLKDQLGALTEPDRPDESADDLRARIKSLNQQIAALETDITALNQLKSYREELARTEKPTMSLDKTQKRLNAVETELETLSGQREAFQRYEKNAPRFEAIQKQLVSAKNHYKTLCEKYERKIINPAKAVKLTQSLIKDLETQLEEADAVNALYEQQTDDRELSESDVKPEYKTAEAYQSAISELSEQIAVLRRTLKSVESGDEYCSVCGSDLKAADHDAKALKRDIKKGTETLERWENESEVLRVRKINFVGHVESKPLRVALKQVQAINAAAQAYLEAKQRADDVDAPKKIEFDEDRYGALIKRRDVLNHQLVSIKVYNNLVKAGKERIATNPFRKLSDDELDDQKRTLAKQQKTLAREQTTLTDTLVEAETNSALYKRYRQEHKILITQARELQPFERDFRILTSLRKALGRDGFRTKRLEKTLEVFVSNLNELAPLLWNEPIKFEIETGPRKCDVIAHRNNRKGTAFKLSGSENRCWQLLAGLAMLRILPANRRCNTIILDELEANLDEGARHRMMRDFLPELQKTVANIVIVSPLTIRELGIQPDRAFEVVKNKGRSSLLTH